MTTYETRAARSVPTTTPPGPGVRTVALLAVLMCLGFATANVLLLVGFRLGAPAPGPLEGFGAGLAVMNVLALFLKLVGAAVAGLSVARTTWPLRPAVLGLLLWGAATTLVVYAVGALAEAVAMVAGFLGGMDRIDARSVAYLIFVLTFAASFAVLAVSFSRRHHLPARTVALGAVGAPVLLGLLLFGIPAVLGTVGLLPT